MGTLFVIALDRSSDARRSPTIFPMDEGRQVISRNTFKVLTQEKITFTVLEELEGSAFASQIIYPMKSFLYSTPDEGAVEEICAKIYASQHRGILPYAVFLGRNPNLEEGAFILDKPGGRRQYQWKLMDEKPHEQNMADVFPRFLHAVQDEDTKFVLSFGSGGLRLFAQPSMMKFINDIKARTFVDEVWGCSGGSLSGLCYSMAVEPEAIEQKGYDIYNEKFSFRLSPSIFSVLKNIILDTFLPTPPNVLKGYLSVQSAMQIALHDLIGEKKCEIPFYCVAYNVKRLRNEILTPLEVVNEAYRDIMTRARPIDAVAASSSIPIVYVPKQIRKGEENEAYIDGATAEPVPLLSVYRKWKIDKAAGVEKRRKLLILAIDPLPGRARSSWMFRHIFRRCPYVDLARFGLRFFKLVLQARISNHIELLGHDPDVQLILVSLPLSTSTILDVKKIPRIIHDAQTVFLDQMLKVEKSLLEERSLSWI